MLIVKEACACGNRDASKFVEYDGCLGYEAVICTLCGRFSDHTGVHEADEFSKTYVGRN